MSTMRTLTTRGPGLALSLGLAVVVMLAACGEARRTASPSAGGDAAAGDLGPSGDAGPRDVDVGAGVDAGHEVDAGGGRDASLVPTTDVGPREDGGRVRLDAGDRRNEVSVDPSLDQRCAAVCDALGRVCDPTHVWWFGSRGGGLLDFGPSCGLTIDCERLPSATRCQTLPGQPPAPERATAQRCACRE
jgi:hypothetical protein